MRPLSFYEAAVFTDMDAWQVDLQTQIFLE